MKSFLALLVACLSLSLNGCLFIAKRQLENKIPRINAESVQAELSTIYGVSGTLNETGVKWTGDSKAVGSQEIRVTSPIGSFKSTIKGASTPSTASAP